MDSWDVKSNVVTKGSMTHPAILLLHGIGADYHMWHLQIDVFANAGYFVIVPDLLGHGKTEDVSSITLEDWNSQILHILSIYSIDKVIVAGVSMGGVIAQNFAIRHENKVNQLILSDTFCELKSLKEKMLGYSQVIGFHIFKWLGSKMLSKGMASTYKADFARHAKDYFTSSDRIYDFKQLIMARKAINQADFKAQLHMLTVPAFVLVGNEMGECFVGINQKIAEQLSNSTFLILDQAMDPSCLTNPHKFNREVLSFLES